MSQNHIFVAERIASVREREREKEREREREQIGTGQFSCLCDHDAQRI